jgi:hypothetical protein
MVHLSSPMFVSSALSALGVETAKLMRSSQRLWLIANLL